MNLNGDSVDCVILQQTRIGAQGNLPLYSNLDSKCS